jgi:uncharacterized spore protein YtfJ
MLFLGRCLNKGGYMVDELIKTVTTELKEMIKTDTVVGPPTKAGEVVVIPVTKVSVGFGAGGGEGKAEKGEGGKGEGTGGGASIEPVAFVVVSPDGKAQLLPLGAKEATFGKIVDAIPMFISAVKDLRGGGKTEEKKKE